MLKTDLSSDAKQRIDDLYTAACKHGTTYEAVVHSTFCDLVLDEFSDREADKPAFAYAREAYGYQTQDELRATQAEDWNNGVCSHGLDWMTCPAGCFEQD
ncbi:MAG: hypothetical protein ACNJA3_28570 (plasmid) [Pseudomonas rhizophila]|uniref:hypothetical protein n=1 Tax=Pseudomonas rhizophila TaxID=2045200 RepID=UPI003F6D8F5C